jgi:hypothetical protein
VHAEALAVTADFVLNRWDLEILPYSARTMVLPLSCAEPSSISTLDVDAWRSKELAATARQQLRKNHARNKIRAFGRCFLQGPCGIVSRRVKSWS